ncbi:hypothetical protein XF24_00839 [candidate division SR1 bacterium Aalborg_AAW-1]|nr:hypothetical protein XF24_00839 [candidate division SR1 bacterium Aalborg_AAW-1]
MKLFDDMLQWIRSWTMKSKEDGIVVGKSVPAVPSQVTKPEGTLMSYGQMTVFWVIGALIAYVAYLVFNSLSLIYLVLTGLLISVAIESFIIKGQKYLKNRGISIALMYLFLVVFMLAGVVIILPFLLKQLSSIISMIISEISLMGQKISSMGITAYVESLNWIPGMIKNYLLDSLGSNTSELQTTIMQNISTLVSTGSSYASNIGGMALSFVGSLFTILGQIALVLTIAVFFSIEKERVVHFFVDHTSSSLARTQFMSEKVDLFYKKMGTWLKTQLALCLYIFIVVYIALIVLGWFGMPLPNSFSLALMAGFTEFIPYLGPILGAVPAVIVATIIYGWKGLIVVSIVYVIIQQIENNVLVPMLMNKSLGVSPLLILLCALFFGSILGFIGILLAVPFAILITMVVKKDFQ